MTTKFLAPKLTKSELNDPTKLSPTIKKLEKELIKSLLTVRSESIDKLLLYMHLNDFEKLVLIQNFDVLLERAKEKMKKSQVDYFGWALLFAYLHYRQQKYAYWGLPVPSEGGGKVTYGKPQIKREFPQVPQEVQQMYHDRAGTLIDSLSDELRNGVKEDLELARSHGWDEEKTKKKLDERFRKAEYRASMIAVTEMCFVYNDFIKRKAREDGITHLIWVTANDERVCPVCGPRHLRVYPIDDVPDIPVHPQCRCRLMIPYSKK